MRTALFALFGILVFNSAHALTCSQVREKAKSKKGKPACTMIEHNAAPSERGSALTVYQCGGTKYYLTTMEDDTCLVSNKP